MAKFAHAIAIERAKRNFSAYVPDLPGSVVTGKTEAEVLRLMREAIQLHLEDMIEDGEAIPRPSSISRTVKTKLAVA
jgi:predicted RNase H-like HicB family nuclease